MSVQEISKLFNSLADPGRAAHAIRYFKAGKGEYAEGDRFLGIRVPVIRAQVKKYESVTLHEIQKLLMSPWHEVRLYALLVLVRKFERGDAQTQAAIYELYLHNLHRVNNWDLVDSSARQIVGSYLENRDRQMLYKLVKSDNIWERRVAVISTFHFINLNQFEDALKLGELLLQDKHDLIHKAVGWMLREIGKRDMAVEKVFLRLHCKTMPRTMLRYAIEKFPGPERKQYLAGAVQDREIQFH